MEKMWGDMRSSYTPNYGFGFRKLGFRLFYNRRVTAKACSHLNAGRSVELKSDVCNECLELGDVWPALRVCMTCGYVGCCTRSKNKHISAHHEETKHPIIAALGEGNWMWCFPDEAIL